MPVDIPARVVAGAVLLPGIGTESNRGHWVRGLFEVWKRSWTGRVVAQPFPTGIGDFPEAPAASFHAPIRIDHGIACPLGGIAPTDGFAVGLEKVVVLGLKHRFHTLTEPVEHLGGFALATHGNQHLEDGPEVVGVGRDLALPGLAKKAFAHDLLHLDGRRIAHGFEFCPFVSEVSNLLPEGGQAFGEIDDGLSGVVVPYLHGMGALLVYAVDFGLQGLAEQVQGGGDIITVGGVRWRFRLHIRVVLVGI